MDGNGLTVDDAQAIQKMLLELNEYRHSLAEKLRNCGAFLF